jgi:hypothetical protein
MVKEKTLYVEGSLDAGNGDLRQGFSCLLEKKLKGKMPRIVMGGGKKNAIDKFINSNDVRTFFLLVDLDKVESFRKNDIDDYGLESKEEFVFFMIQEMEAWFLSQLDILDSFCKSKISTKIPEKDPREIEKSDEFLQNLTKSSKKRKYHKVKHGVELLKKLDPDILYEKFNAFKNMIDKLQMDC